MICKKCRQFAYLQALSEGICFKCGKPTPTPHLPSYKICKKCGEKYKLCEQCGVELNIK